MSATVSTANGERVVYACSGAADVGEIADRAARMIARAGSARMSCLAGIGGCCEPVLETARTAARILAIDGCTEDCARKALEQAGLKGFQHLRVTDFNLEKGKAAVTVQNVSRVATRGQGLLNV